VFYFIYNLFLKKKSALGAALGTTAASSALTPAQLRGGGIHVHRQRRISLGNHRRRQRRAGGGGS
jgi:hypothetical protein